MKIFQLKKNKKIIYISFLVTTVLFLGSLDYLQDNQNKDILVDLPNEEFLIATRQEYVKDKNFSDENKNISTVAVDPKIIDTQPIVRKDLENLEESAFSEIDFYVNGTLYKAPYQEGDTVLSLMNRMQIKNEHVFNFKSKNYPYLGEFIEEINGTSEKGKYWIYYINDKEASVGVSKLELKKDDIIKWVLR
jgi:hypothetical protein